MKIIDKQNWPRRQHFEYFMQLDTPQYHLCADIDVAPLYQYCKSQQLSFFIACVYVITRAANQVAPFRMRIRDEQVVEHEIINPSFTVPAPEDLFSYCYTEFEQDFADYHHHAQQQIAKSTQCVTLDEPVDRDDFYFMSSVPWVKFTSISHAMNNDPTDSTPRFSWGKFEQTSQGLMMPVQAQVHHALVDGAHLGKFYQQIQKLLNEPDSW